MQVWCLIEPPSSCVYMHRHPLILRSSINNRQQHLCASAEAMKMQTQTMFAATAENWPHLLEKHSAELALIAKSKKKGYLPPGAPTFLKQNRDFDCVGR